MGWNAQEFPAMRPERHYGGRVVDCFVERPRNLWQLLEEPARDTPEAEALVGDGRRLTWGGVKAEAEALARALSHQGITRGDRVVLSLRNSPDFVLVLFALYRIGAVAVPFSIRASRPELAYAIANSGAVLQLYDESLAALVPEAADRPGCRALSLAGLDRGSAAAPELPALDALPGEEEVALILHTSGTTGRPKGAMLTHLALLHAAMLYQAALGLGPQDRVLAAAPLNHVTGIAGLISTAFRCRATLIIQESFRAETFLDLAVAERMTYTMMAPAMFNLLLLQPDFTRRDLSHWRLAAYGGAPMPEPTIRRLQEAMPGLGLCNCYGATEVITAPLITPPSEAFARRDCVGAPLPGTRVLVMDAAGRALPPGEEGEIWMAGPNVVPGYWNNPEASAEAFVAGYWRSGDLGVLTEDGYLRVLDRVKDMINRGGLKVYSAELESVLADHPAVIEAAALARPCDVLGERVHAVVCAREPVSPDDLRAWCRERLSDYKLPETLDISAQPLPRVPNGKIDKKVLRAALSLT